MQLFTLTGRIATPDNVPVQGCVVRAFMLPTRVILEDTGIAQTVKTKTDAGGQFTLRLIKAEGVRYSIQTEAPERLPSGLVIDPWTLDGDTATLADLTAPAPPELRPLYYRGIRSIADPDGDGTAVVTYSDGTTDELGLPPGPATKLSIGSVTDGAEASASITGKAPSQTLNLVLPKGDPGQWNAHAQAQAQGFWTVVSDTPPTETTKYGVPVVWVQRSTALTEVPAVPPQPSWNMNLGEVTVADPVGAYYVLTTNVDPTPRVLTPGVATSVGTQRPIVATVEAKAKSGYYLSSTMRWSKQLLDFNALTIIASDDFTGPAGPLVQTSALDGDSSYTAGRQFNNALGGAQTRFWEMHRNVPTHEISADGRLSTWGTPTRWGDESYVGVVGQDMYVSFDLAQIARAHASSVIAQLGGASFSVDVDSNALLVTLRAPDATTSTNTISVNGAPNDIFYAAALGKWEAWRFQGTISVKTPAGDVFSLETPQASLTKLTDRMYVRLIESGQSAGVRTQIDNLRVGKW